MTSRFRSSRRVAYVGFWAALVLMAMQPAAPLAQSPAIPFFVPGRNVNTLGPIPAGANPMLAGNPKHKQRNEASCDVSPLNPLVVLCANNDYRGVEVFGDSWIGLSMSTDGARTWRDRLLEGFPTSPNGIGAADPVVRTVPGLGLVAYITLSRADGRGTLSLAVMHERNKENGEPYEFYEKRLIGTGTPGRFQDKPAMLAVLDLPKTGAPNDTIDVGGRPIPKGTVHYAYSLFPGTENNSSSQIYHTFSKNYGLTWSQPKKLSESLGINQGADLAYDETTNALVAVWRQVADNNQADAIVFARSGDGGQTWSKPQVVWTAKAGQFFDQDTAALQFRTRAMPSIIYDRTAFRVFWSAREFASGANTSPEDARIVVKSSGDGLAWSAQPTAIAPFDGRGHQIIPQAAVAGGRIQVDWIDTRNNEPGSFGRYIADFRMDAAGKRIAIDDPRTDTTYIYRQMGDIYAVQASVGGTLTFSPSQSVSRYRFGLVDGVRRQLEYSFLNAKLFQKGGVPFHGDYHAIASQRYRPSETTAGAWVNNASESTSHAVFYAAFTDNRDVQGYVWAGPGPSSFTPAGGTQQGESGLENAVPCAPSSETTADLTVWTASDSPRSRYQNIYAAATLPGLVVTSPSGSKPVGGLERAYVVFVQNLTREDRDFQFTVSNQPPDAPPNGTIGRASFRPDSPTVPDATCEPGSDCRIINVRIPRGSSATRTVYVRSATVRPRITVVVQETGGGLNGSVILNANPNVAEIENPDAFDSLPDILTGEYYQPGLLPRQTEFFSTGVVNPDVTPVTIVTNPRIEYPRIEYPRIEYPRIEYPRIEYPRIEYDSVGNPRIEYPRIEYPRIEYRSVQNPRIEYSPLAGDDGGVVTTPTQVTDITWPVTTGVSANTLTGMTSQVFVNGTIPVCDGSTTTQNCIQAAQLLVSVPQFYTVTRSCGGEQTVAVENQVIVNNVIGLASLRPTLGGPDTVNPAITQPTFFVGPTQVAFVTLRLVGRFDLAFSNLLSSRTGIIVRSQPDKTGLDSANDTQDGTIDITAPTLIIGDVSSLANVEGNTAGGANVTVTVTATDDSKSATVSCVRTGSGGSAPLPADGTSTFIPLGPWTATCTAVDPSGNESQPGTFPINVVDTTPPTLDVSGLAATVRLTPSFTGIVLSYNPAVVTASDVVWGNLTSSVIFAPPSPTTLQAGSAAITCTVKDGSGNSASAAYTFTVAKAATTTTVTAANATYDGSSHGATAVVTGPGGFDLVYSGTGGTSYGPTTVPPTNAGTYVAAATYAENLGYLGSAGSATFQIAKATTATVVTCPASVVYTGAAQTPCSVAVTGAGGLSLSPAPIYANNTAAGTATASYTYPGDANHTGSAGSATFDIVMPPAPTVTAVADPNVLLWSPNKTMTPVTVSGGATGPGVTGVSFTVKDEYGKIQPSGTAKVGAGGTYSFVVMLEAYRNGTDADGRLYTITVSTTDKFGRVVTTTTTVRVPHNQ